MYTCAPFVCRAHIVLKRATDPPGTGIIVSYELLCGCWESSLNPLEEQPGFLAPSLCGIALEYKQFYTEPLFLKCPSILELRSRLLRRGCHMKALATLMST